MRGLMIGALLWGVGGCGNIVVPGGDCVPNCVGRACGTDGCGGSCGECKDDGLSCTTETCSEAGICETPVQPLFCLIEASCVTDGTVSPGNPCLVCRPDVSQTDWSDVDDGTACESGTCEDGVCVSDCVPECVGDCGDDGCGGSCGECTAPEVCVDGGCQCESQCGDKTCGDDGCGGSCGNCGPEQACEDGQCMCQPDCEDAECGDDGCAGVCGACEFPDVCSDERQCVCQAQCDGLECGDDQCGGLCGECVGQDACVDGQCVCQPQCEAVQCGDDGCGGECGPCEGQNACVDGQCVCQPQCEAVQCGDDGCGGDCGACPLTHACQDGLCVCQPQCTGKDCGDDGCGGDCGSCLLGLACVDGQCACAPQCTDKNCGDDGCGGTCGSCAPGTVCTDGQCGCAPICDDGFECGDDGCGGSCGTCDPGTECVDGMCECAPQCGANKCGDDGCGGTCPECPQGAACNQFGNCATGSCAWSCGQSSPGGCYCDDLCFQYGDCCADVCETCARTWPDQCGLECPDADCNCMAEQCGAETLQPACEFASVAPECLELLQAAYLQGGCGLECEGQSIPALNALCDSPQCALVQDFYPPIQEICAPCAPPCTPWNCDDGNPCTMDLCTPSGCQNVPAPTGTEIDGCQCAQGGECVPTGCEGGGCAVGHWPLNEGEGTAVKDVSGNGNTGTLQPGVYWDNQAGITAACFDGIDGAIVVPDTDTLDITDALTLEATVFLLSPEGGGVISKFGIGGSPDSYMLAVENGAPIARFAIEGLNGFVSTTAGQIPLQKWTHIAVAWDGQITTLYVDYQAVKTTVLADPIKVSSADLAIGAKNMFADDPGYFEGCISNARVTPLGLSASELLPSTL